ncbi:MAG: hypothetical protein NT178_13550 [Proteobacteria bacterium]|nr:hypothetical protein [Pseudomonadota bacterium]
MVSKSAAQRQKEKRDRKKKTGKYINIFISNEIIKKIKGRPSIIVEHFHAFSDLIKIIEDQKKENIMLRQRLDDSFNFTKMISEEWLKVYNEIKIPIHLGLNKDVVIAANAKRRKEKKRNFDFDILTYKQKELYRMAIDYASMMRNELFKYYEVMTEIKKVLVNLSKYDENSSKFDIQEIKDKCWKLSDNRIDFDKKEEIIYYQLKNFF